MCRIHTTDFHAVSTDPMARYDQFAKLKGLPIVIVTPDAVFEGVLIHMARPDRTHRAPAPVATLATDHGNVSCPVHVDSIIAPSGE